MNTPTDLPPELDTPQFRQAWADWLTYRRERRLAAYKPIGLTRQLNALARYGEASAIAAIDESIRQNYQGLFPKQGKVRVGSAGEFSGAF